jgi:hypothetical protein
VSAENDPSHLLFKMVELQVPSGTND